MKKHIFNNNKIVIASHNKGKVKEITIMLKPLKIEVLSAVDFNLKEPIEDGLSFEKNALIKSSYVCENTGIPSLSDDSGICFCDLNNEPGVYSARWAGEGKNFNLAMSKINDSIMKVETPSYDCFFVCALSLSWPNEDNVTVSGKINGKFSWPPKGDFGFGYDPIFKPLGYDETFAEMDPEFKHTISHRALAFKKLISLCFPSLKN
jgi:XTP/dITP diphosphohydrolase